MTDGFTIVGEMKRTYQSKNIWYCRGTNHMTDDEMRRIEHMKEPRALKVIEEARLDAAVFGSARVRIFKDR